MAAAAISAAASAAVAISGIIVLRVLKNDVQKVDSNAARAITAVTTVATVSTTLAAGLGNASQGQDCPSGKQLNALTVNLAKAQCTRHSDPPQGSY
ncbi:MAG TPA: hypothetical protein VJS67_13670 [Pseudonocardiaceae bacterium]|nr:hypothetical protein [Pseudonocardiaceae bacterium]